MDQRTVRSQIKWSSNTPFLDGGGVRLCGLQGRGGAGRGRNRSVVLDAVDANLIKFKFQNFPHVTAFHQSP